MRTKQEYINRARLEVSLLQTKPLNLKTSETELRCRIPLIVLNDLISENKDPFVKEILSEYLIFYTRRFKYRGEL